MSERYKVVRVRNGLLGVYDRQAKRLMFIGGAKAVEAYCRAANKQLEPMV